MSEESKTEYFFKLKDEHDIKPFESTDVDLNGFLINDAKSFNKGLLATTYIIENKDKSIAYFSILNDSLRMEEITTLSRSAKKKFPRGLEHRKRSLKTYPAIKIGRLAVCKLEKGYGSLIMNWIIDFAVKLNEQVGCRFITVDAYASAVGFYEKKGFIYFNDNDRTSDTRQMYLDITQYANAY